MARTLRYHPLFDCDVREAAGWYDRRSPSLGEGFVEVVRQGIDNIVSDPYRLCVVIGRLSVYQASPVSLRHTV
jgi:hypothetical protein